MPFNPTYATLRASFGWKDILRAAGKFEVYHDFQPVSTVASINAVTTNIYNLAQKLSNAKASGLEARLLPYPFPQALGGNAAYPDAEDKAVFTFTTAKNQLIHVEIPAPVENVFSAGGYYVDQTQADVANFIALLTNGHFSSNVGDPITALVKAVRGERRREITGPRLP